MSGLIGKTIDLLGQRARDKVTGFEGVIECVSFDLYGCVQITLRPGLDEKGLPKDGRWFDVARMDIIDAVPIMPVPDFEGRATEPAAYDHGPADKPAR
jgi:hypothetical protein